MGDDGHVRTDLPFWKDILQESSFRVEPSSCLIQPYGSQTFRVVLFRTGKYGFGFIFVIN